MVILIKYSCLRYPEPDKKRQFCWHPTALARALPAANTVGES
jgi:hypothetical protein